MTSQYHQFSRTFRATRNVAQIAAQVVSESTYGNAASVRVLAGSR